MSRRKAREFAFKVIFQVDQVDAEPRTAYNCLLDEQSLADKDHDFCWNLIEGTLENMDNIDSAINRYSSDWALERMSSVDRNVMRLASYEILFMQDAEPVVAINEAIEMGKRYGEDNSAAFINAILDKIFGERK